MAPKLKPTSSTRTYDRPRKSVGRNRKQTVFQRVDTVKSGGAAVGAINQPRAPVHVGGRQYYGSVTINEGASIDEILAALRQAGVLARLTTRVPEQQFLQLLNIIMRLGLKDSGDVLFRVYRATLPPTAHLLNNPIPSLLVADLCEQPPVKIWPPLIEFVERLALAEGIKAPLAGELRSWVDASAPLLMPPIPAGEIKRGRQELQAEKVRLAGLDALSWLQVYLEPDWLNRTQERKTPLFRVELVLWSPLTNGALVLPSEPVLHGTDESGLWSLDELPSLLDHAFERVENVALIPDMLRLIIEIVAPSDVLLYGFERWKRNKSMNTYGIYRPLVVRLRDRLAIPNPADQKLADDYWHEKWNIFRNTALCQKCEQLNWRRHADLDVLELQDDSTLACLGLSWPLVPGEREVFDVLRDAGIPIAIWLRGSDVGPGVPADWTQRLSASLEGTPLAELRHAIYELRRSKAVRTDEKHIGNSLTLLWDEPDRPPLKYGQQGVFV